MTRTPSFRFLAAGAALVALLLASCASIRTDSDYDPSTDFTGFDAYAWAPKEKETDAADVDLADSELVQARIERAVDAVLAAKGHRRTSLEEASFVVVSHVVVDKKMRVDTLGGGYGVRGWYGYADTRVREYEVGTLVLDFVSAGEERKLLWRGTGSRTLSRRHETPEEREAETVRVVEAILAQFPPGGPGEDEASR